ncbi:MAG: response regulator [Gallionella sp.]|nr:response regulator [Gallionella sp.]
MSEKASIFVVDDDDFMHEMFAEALNKNYRITPVESGADSLFLAQKERPDLVILDVEMPGMDGYETCRRLKKTDAMADVPVMFVSAHDKIEDRLKGYEAGGEDYIIKPFDPQELEAKVAQLLKAVSERAALKQMADYAASTAMTAMTSISEMGALIETLKKFNVCNDSEALIEAMLKGLALYGLGGAVQIRSHEETLTRNNQGWASPLETSIINHMSKMERITQFQSKLCVTYPSISLLVHDMPVEDVERCGRLRDHLAMLVDGAEARILGINAVNESRQRGKAIERAVERITETLKEIDSAQRQSQVGTKIAFSALIDKIEKAIIKVAPTVAQEKLLSDIVRKGIEEIMYAPTSEFDVQDKLTTIISELKGMVDAK